MFVRGKGEALKRRSCWICGKKSRRRGKRLSERRQMREVHRWVRERSEGREVERVWTVR